MNVYDEIIEELETVVKNGIGGLTVRKREFDITEQFNEVCKARGTLAEAEIRKFMVFYCQTSPEEINQLLNQLEEPAGA